MTDTTKPRNYPGQARRNDRRRNDKDPDLIGWAYVPGVKKGSIAVWFNHDKEAGTIRPVMSLKPFGVKVRSPAICELHVNTDRRAKVAPEMIGDLTWRGQDYTVAVWIEHSDKPGEPPVFNFRIRLAEPVAYPGLQSVA